MLNAGIKPAVIDRRYRGELTGPSGPSLQFHPLFRVAPGIHNVRIELQPLTGLKKDCGGDLARRAEIHAVSAGSISQCDDSALRGKVQIRHHERSCDRSADSRPIICSILTT